MEATTNINGNLSTNMSDNNTFIFPASPIGPDFYNAYNIFLYLMIALGVSGNFIVLAVFTRHPPSTTTDWFILFITVCDFISSLINVPVYASFTNGYWRVYGTTLVCRLHMFLSQSLVLSSSFLISGLALERYLKICKQLSSFSKARARNACLLITILTTFLSTPCFMMYENRGGRCVSIAMDKTLFAYYLMVFLVFIFATVIVIFSYCKVSKAVIESERNVLRHTENTRYTGEDGTNTRLCFCSPFFRRNRVAPSTTVMSRSGLFRDTIVAQASLESSSNLERVQTVNDKDRLQVPKYPNNRKCSTSPGTSVSGTISEHVTNNSLTPSTRSSEHINKGYRSISLRTTNISFLVCSVFIVTWIPPWLCFILASVPAMKTNIDVIKFMIFGRMTYLINGFSNPVIYILMNKKFRKHILEIFCRRK